MDEGNKDQLIGIPLADVVRVRAFLEDMVAFFHQPMHYEEGEDVLAFMKQGTYDEMSALFYSVTYDWLPAELKEEIARR